MFRRAVKVILVPELRGLDRQVQAVNQELMALLNGMSERGFMWRPNPRAWSVSESVIHLNRFGRDAFSVMDGMIYEAMERRLHSPGPFRYGTLSRLMLRLTEPPYRLQFPAFPEHQPERPLPQRQVLPPFFQQQEELRSRMVAANGLDLAAVRAPLPRSGVELALGQWFALVLSHQRRHLWQISQTRRQPGFPG